MAQASFSDQLARRARLGAVWRLSKLALWAAALTVFGAHLAFGTHNSDQTTSVLIGIPLLLGGLGWLAYLVSNGARIFSPDRDPLSTALAKVKASPVSRGDLDRSFAGMTFHGGRLNVSSDYVAFAGNGGVYVSRLDDLAWVYPAQITHKINGVIPYKRTHQIHIWPREGKGFVGGVRKAAVEPSLRELKQAAPWLPVHYSSTIADTWNNDRTDFIAYLDQQRSAAKQVR